MASADADTERFLILEGMTRLLALVSHKAPLVIVLDDLHWVDAASVQMLRHLLASAMPMALLIMGTFRASELSRSHPLTGVLADLHRVTAIDRLNLLGLEDTEILDLLEAAAGHDVADDGVALARALRRETGGNPFFLVEVIRHLATRQGPSSKTPMAVGFFRPTRRTSNFPQRAGSSRPPGRSTGRRDRAGFVAGLGHRPRFRRRCPGRDSWCR